MSRSLLLLLADSPEVPSGLNAVSPARAAALFALAAFLLGSGCHPQAREPSCGPQTCGGCCDSNGLCQQGVTGELCGALGRACEGCGSQGVCLSSACLPASVSTPDAGEPGPDAGGGAPDAGEVDGGEPSDAGPPADGGQPSDGGQPADGGEMLGECTAAAFCWLWPLPQGNALRATWFAAPDDGWAVGSGGRVYRWDGSAWTRLSSPVLAHQYLEAVWGTGPNDVWIAGMNVMLHWDGQRLASRPVPGGGYFYGLGGTGPQDVWAVGGGPFSSSRSARWDGTAWVPVVTCGGTMRSVKAISTSEVYAVGDGSFCRFNGSSWTPINGATDSMYGLAAVAPNDIWINGTAGVRRWNGTSLAAVNTPAPAGPFSLWASSAADVWIAGGRNVSRFDGAQWTASPLPDDAFLTHVGGTALGDVWAAGWAGALFRFDRATGTAARVMGGQRQRLLSVHPDSARSAWFGAENGWLLRYEQQAFRQQKVGGLTDHFSAVWGAAPDDVWAAARNGTLFRFNGASWFEWPTTLNGEVNAMWGSAANDLWAVGDSVARWNGSAWVQSSVVGTFHGIFGLGPQDVWMVGEQGRIAHFDGAAWSQTPSGTTALLSGVWGASSGEVWAAGDGVVLRWNGSAWSTVASGSAVATVRAVAGSSASDVWFGAQYGGAGHWDGAQLTWYAASEVGSSNSWNALWPRPGGGAWLVGDAFSVVRTPR